jgi:hypothetical protein
MIRFIATSNEEEDLLADELSDEARWKLREEMKQAIYHGGLHASCRLRRLNSPPACFSDVQPTPKQ